jgi:hypothetical protein
MIDMKKNIFRNTVCVLLCLLMLTGGFLVSCNKNDEPAGDNDEVSTEEKVTVVRLKENIKYGTKVTSAKLEEVQVNKADLPEGTILNKDDVLGKFTLTAMYAGEYFLPVKLADKRPSNVDENGDVVVEEDDGVINFEDAGYVMVTDYLKPDTGADVSDAIQKLIDENPNRTLYFPDGVYMLSKPITTSADPTKTVSFKLSNFAHFKAMPEWETRSEPLFKLGATDMAEGIGNDGNHYSVEGGIFDGSDVADAIWVMNAGNVALRYISIKNAVVGIHVKADENGNGPTADVHTVNIVGSGTVDSYGVILDTNDNTLTNMRIASNQIAIKLTGSENFLRNLHPLYIFEDGLNPPETYKDSVAFYDVGKRNFYDNCYNDQFATGFYFGKDTASVLDCCFNYWYSEKHAVHNSYVCEGQFNCIIRYSSSDVGHADKGTECNFLLVGEAGGKGTIDTVYYNPNKVSEKDVAKDYLINDPIY